MDRQRLASLRQRLIDFAEAAVTSTDAGPDLRPLLWHPTYDLSAAMETSSALPTGPLTFLFTDIEGSTRLREAASPGQERRS